MTDIFISYRRGDSAGHAGRLFDGLKERLGEAHVFMDVTGLRPGQDFAVELAQAVGRADCLLALIGPRWLEAVDESGRRRIDDPDDFVRREIVAGLAGCAVVIPVLVHGAQMPRAVQLPEPLRPLLRRQAFELSDQRWEGDLLQLIQSLRVTGSGVAAPTGTPSTAVSLPVKWLYGGGAVLLVGMAWVTAGSWWPGPAANLPVSGSASGAARSNQTIGLSSTAQGRMPSPAVASPPPQRFSVALPPVAEVRFRTHRAQVVFSILSIRQEPRDSSKQVLTFLVRMLNRGPADEAFGSDQFRLIAGDQSLAPTSPFNSITETTEAKETVLRFVAPASAVDVTLEVRINGESSRMLVALSARSPIPYSASLDDFGRAKPARVVDTLRQFPAVLEADKTVQVGKVNYTLSSAVIERENVEKASLAVTLRCSPPRGSGGVSFGSSTVRLWIDGVPRVPINSVNLAVDPGDSKEAVFFFDLVSMPKTLEVGILSEADSVKLPLSLASLVRR